MSNTQLPAELQAEILAKSVQYGRNNSTSVKIEFSLTEGYQIGATIYATRWQEAEDKLRQLQVEHATIREEVVRLRRLNKESAELMDPIVTWGHEQSKTLKLGQSIFAAVLDYAKKWEAEGMHSEKLAEALEEAEKSLNWMWDNMTLQDGKKHLQSDAFNVPANAIDIAQTALSEYRDTKNTTNDPGN